MHACLLLIELIIACISPLGGHLPPPPGSSFPFFYFLFAGAVGVADLSWLSSLLASLRPFLGMATYGEFMAVFWCRGGVCFVISSRSTPSPSLAALQVHSPLSLFFLAADLLPTLFLSAPIVPPAIILGIAGSALRRGTVMGLGGEDCVVSQPICF